MKEIKGNIWDFYAPENTIIIFTNGIISRTNQAVMGKGIALEAKNRFPNLPLELANCIKQAGNRVHDFPQYHLMTFPTKHDWKDKSDLKLIEISCQQIIKYDYKHFFLGRPGCGLRTGQLNWETQVKEICEFYLDDRFTIVNNE